MSADWSQPNVDRLTRWWSEGHTASAIAGMFGDRSRNAVIGKAHKLGLLPRPHKGGGVRLTRDEALASNARYEAKHGRKGTRKAYAALGDDVSFSRFVKVPHDGPGGHLKASQLKLPGFGGSIEAGRSVFHNRGVKPVDAFNRLLVSGHANVKIGNDVRLGERFLGYHIYTLTLEERATCPVTCHHWRTCYGNNMPFAKRISHADPTGLQGRLEAEIEELLARPWAGILIRLHALGDFFSVDYVSFWILMLHRHPRLAVYGYTARDRELDPIGRAVAQAKAWHGRRFAIRWSDGGGAEDCTVSIRPGDPKPEDAFVCPEQTGRVAVCGKCGLCWNKTRNVAFIEH